MKNGWKRVCLEQLTADDSPITYGVVKPGASGDVLFIRGGDVSEGRVLHDQLRTITSEVSKQYRRTLLRGGELLVSLVGQPGQVAVVPPALAGANIARQVGLVRLGAAVDASFISYFLRSPDGQTGLGTFTGGSVQQVINLGDLRKVPVPVPHLPEQRRIVGILDEAFAGIATAKANAEKNLQNARALFESHLNAVFTQRGDGWVSATVGELVEQELLAKPLDGNHGEIHPKKSDFVASGVPFIMAAHLSNGAVDQENCYFITKKQASSLRKGFAKDGDVLLSHKGTIGRVAVLETSHAFVVLTPQVTFYRILDDTVLDNRYLYFVFQSPKFQNEMNGIAGGGSTRAYIGITKQQELRIDYPRLDDQKQIASTLEDLARETQRLESIYQRKLTALDELKKSLLHQAFSGEL